MILSPTGVGRRRRGHLLIEHEQEKNWEDTTSYQEAQEMQIVHGGDIFLL
jgi:hypothetical protein